MPETLGWRDVFEIPVGASPSFEHVQDLYRDRVGASDLSSSQLQTLRAALDAAHKELEPHSVVDGTIHNEQLLPP